MFSPLAARACLLAFCGSLAMSPAALAEVTKRTFTYKEAGTLAIRADVYREADDRVRPVVVWIHGGALIMGHREGVSLRLKEAMLAAGRTIPDDISLVILTPVHRDK